VAAFGFVGMFFHGSGMPYVLGVFRLNSTKLLLFITKKKKIFGIPAGAQ